MWLLDGKVPKPTEARKVLELAVEEFQLLLSGRYSLEVGEDGRHANQNSFGTRDDVYPSMDCSPQKIDTSIFFDQQATFKLFRPLIEERFKASFQRRPHTQGRNGGYRVYLPVTSNNPTAKSWAEALCQQYVTMVAVTNDLFQEQSPQDVRKAELDAAVARSLSGITTARVERLQHTDELPASYRAEVVLYRRNPDVVAERLHQARGACEKCKQAASFNRRADGRPYLEVHHKKPLSEGGLDNVDNTIALCPNCHREMHYG